METNNRAPSSVTLGIGARVMLVTNKDVKEKLTNGRQGVLIRWQDDGAAEAAPKTAAAAPSPPLAVVRFDKTEVDVVVRPHTWTKKYGLFEAWYKQMPLRLCWKITIHKSQGLSVDEAAMMLTGLFQMGQFYTAVSRVKTMEGLIVLGYTGRHSIMVDQKAIEYYKRLELQKRQERK